MVRRAKMRGGSKGSGQTHGKLPRSTGIGAPLAATPWWPTLCSWSLLKFDSYSLIFGGKIIFWGIWRDWYGIGGVRDKFVLLERGSERMVLGSLWALTISGRLSQLQALVSCPSRLVLHSLPTLSFYFCPLSHSLNMFSPLMQSHCPLPPHLSPVVASLPSYYFSTLSFTLTGTGNLSNWINTKVFMFDSFKKN